MTSHEHHLFINVYVSVEIPKSQTVDHWKRMLSLRFPHSTQDIVLRCSSWCWVTPTPSHDFLQWCVVFSEERTVNVNVLVVELCVFVYLWGRMMEEEEPGTPHFQRLISGRVPVWNTKTCVCCCDRACWWWCNSLWLCQRDKVNDCDRQHHRCVQCECAALSSDFDQRFCFRLLCYVVRIHHCSLIRVTAPDSTHTSGRGLYLHLQYTVLIVCSSTIRLWDGCWITVVLKTF